MQRYDCDMSIQELKFEKTTFQVQIHVIHLRYMTLEVAIKICEVMEDVLRPVVSNVSDGGSFLRVQVLVDISLPLCCGRLFSLNNKKHFQASFKYERLPNMCDWYGRLTHDDRDYEPLIERERTLCTNQKKFEPDLRAPPFILSNKNV